MGGGPGLVRSRPGAAIGQGRLHGGGDRGLLVLAAGAPHGPRGAPGSGYVRIPDPALVRVGCSGSNASSLSIRRIPRLGSISARCATTSAASTSRSRPSGTSNRSRARTRRSRRAPSTGSSTASPRAGWTSSAKRSPSFSSPTRALLIAASTRRRSPRPSSTAEGSARPPPRSRTRSGRIRRPTTSTASASRSPRAARPARPWPR